MLDSVGDATDSTSILRDPGASENLIRGSSDYFPFLPGGFEEKEEVTEQDMYAQTLHTLFLLYYTRIMSYTIQPPLFVSFWVRLY